MTLSTANVTVMASIPFLTVDVTKDPGRMDDTTATAHVSGKTAENTWGNGNREWRMDMASRRIQMVPSDMKVFGKTMNPYDDDVAVKVIYVFGSGYSVKK